MIDSSKVLKNTIMLYVRMALMMLITLYTSRIVLEALGIEDYGIYNIVGGIVVMFSFLNLTLTVAIRRFLSVELATGDKNRFVEVFRASVLAVFIASVILIIGLETVGLWFLNNKINIPVGRLEAANYTFQFSILTFLCNMNAVPYNSAIVSCERMGIYAYIGIAEAALKLGLIFFLPMCGNDKLIVYSSMIFFMALLVLFYNYGYCRVKIVKIQNVFNVKYSDVIAIFNFSAWSILGSLVFMLATQGVNIIYNLFFGVALNAAMGIAQQVNAAFNQFIGNMQTAFNPPLTKSYASSGLDSKTFDFVCDTSRMTFLLVVIIGFPAILNMDGLLNVWLLNVPKYALQFSILFILYAALDGCSGPLYILVYANGKIKGYQILLSGIQMIYVVIVYILCVYKMSPVFILSLNVLNGLLLFAGRLYILKQMMSFPIKLYLSRVFSSAVFPLLLLSLLGLLIDNGIPGHDFRILVIRLSFSIVATLTILYFVYLNCRERQFILRTIKSKIKK